MVILLHGPDTYRSRARLRVLINAFRRKYDQDGSSVATLAGQTLSVEEFRKAATTVGLFAKRRLVVVESLFTANKRSSVVNEIKSEIKSGLVPEDHVVIFWEPEFIGRSGRSAEPLSIGEKAEEFPLLTGRLLTDWLADTVKKLGGAIEPAAVQQLVVAVGSDLWRLKAELEKLVAYAGQGTINERAVQTLVLSPTETRQFSFTDALASRQTASALRELDRLFKSGAHPLAIVKMIAHQLRTLIWVEEAARDTTNPATVAKRLGIHPYVAKKALGHIRAFRPGELKTIFGRLVALDEKLKSSRLDPAAQLEAFTAAVTNSPARLQRSNAG